MNYQKLAQPQTQFYNHQIFYENPEYVDEAESFIDTVSYSESDGFIGFPMVRSVPSYDIQEIYMRNPTATSSQMLPVAQRSRRYLNGQQALPPEYVYELKPRQPQHLKMKLETNSTQSCAPLPQRQAPGAPRRGGSDRTRSRTCIQGDNKNGMPYRSSPAIPSGPKGPIQKDLTRGFPTRSGGRPVTPMPKKTMCSTSEPATNYQERDPRRWPYRTQPPTAYSRSQETSQVYHPTDSSRKSYPVIVECDGEVKKMNSEGDATGYVDVNDLDAIGRIAATLKEDEVERLSDEQRKDIKEMSKFLVPRVPSSVRSLQEPPRIKRSDSTPNKRETTEKNKEKFHVSFRKSLDSILNQLENCESSLNAVRSKFSVDKNEQIKSERVDSKNDIKDEIFNLKEISEKLRTEGEEEEETVKPVDVIPKVRSDNTMEDVSSGFNSRSGSRGTLDDASAIDLHRSKSYIVNLIDRALSKELGTVSNEEKERFQDLNPIKAVRRIERNKRNGQCDIGEKNVCDLECEPSSSCVKEEEPTYIKQLKELRWGHFKHIQQEVKRLEDLERFLDHCGTSESGAL